MKKKLLILLMTVSVCSLLLSFPAFAGQWQKNSTGWWYDNGDTTYLKDGWHWVDGKCYYFTREGYCLTDTKTPDEYYVDTSGAWTVNGVVQTQNAGTYTLGTLTLTPPAGFSYVPELAMANTCSFGAGDRNAVITVGITDLGVDYYAAYGTVVGQSIADRLFDESMSAVMGNYTSRTVASLATGNWIRYDYQNAKFFDLELPGGCVSFVRISGSQLQQVLFMGDWSGLDAAALMNTFVH